MNIITIETLLNLLNNNKILWGTSMLLLNFGARYLISDLTKFHENILNNQYFKKIIIFSMFFVATRDILTSFTLTILYIIIIDGILHEKNKYCIIPSKYKNTQEITEDEYKKAKDIIKMYEKTMPDNNYIDSSQKYYNNIKKLNSN